MTRQPTIWLNNKELFNCDHRLVGCIPPTISLFQQASGEKRVSEKQSCRCFLLISPPSGYLEQAIPQCTSGPSILGNCCFRLLKLQVLVIVGRNFQTTEAVLDHMTWQFEFPFRRFSILVYFTIHDVNWLNCDFWKSCRRITIDLQTRPFEI